MEPAAAQPARPAGAAGIEQVRAAFPALEREVNGQPLAYLDTRRQRPAGAGLDPGGGPLRAPPPLQRPPRLAHALGGGDRRLRGRPGDRRRPHRRRRPPRGRSSSATRPRRSTWSPTPGATPTSAPGDRIVLTEMEHHSNIVPWQHARRAQPAPRSTGRRSTDDGLLDMERLRGAARARPEAGRRHPRLERARHREPARRDRPRSPTRPVPWCSPTAPRRRRSCRSTMAALGVDFYALTGHKVYGPTGHRRALGAAASCSSAMPPFLGGGSMIRKVTKARHHLRRRRPRASRPARRRSRRRSGWPRPCAGSTGSAWRRSAPTSARSTAYALGEPRRGPGPARLRPAAVAPTGSARSPSSSTASTPTTSPRSSTATGSPCAPATTAPSR